MRKVSVFLVLLAAVAMFAAPAHAGVAIYLSTTGFDSSPSALVASSTGNTTTYNANFGGFSVVSQTVTKNGQGGAIALVNTTNTTVKNTTTGTETLYMIVGGNGFISPVAPPNALLTSGVTGTYSSPGAHLGAADLLTFQSYANGSNVITNAGILTPLQSQAYTVIPFSSTAFNTISSISAPFALAEAVKITLNAGGAVHFVGTTTVTGGLVTTPEPATMTLWGIGLAVCGFAARRRRNAKLA